MTTATLTAAPTIRAATEADVSRLMEMGQRFQRETVYCRGTAWDVDQMGKTARGLIAAEDGLLLVATRDEVVIGMFGALIFTHPITAERTAAEVFFWVEPESRGYGVRLLRRAEQWAERHGAARMQMIAPSPEIETFYRRLGYRALEVTYDKALTVKEPPCLSAQQQL